MPELPDVTVYVEALNARVRGAVLTHVQLHSPFLLRTVTPTTAEIEGKRVNAIRRLGKRIVIALQDDLFAVIHLMIAGRLHWRDAGTASRSRRGLASFEFENGILTLTEAGTKRRASLHLVRGAAALTVLDRGGLEVMDADLPAFRIALTCENHTLKRALTDPRILSGIGNAYSDEILHRARLSPFKQTNTLTEEETARLYDATVATLSEWTDHLRREAGDRFPEGVTAFRKGMSVHGRHGEACPACGTRVQRIVYAEHEANYCPRCQTEGRILADRSLSRLLKANWPKTIEELENQELRRR